MNNNKCCCTRSCAKRRRNNFKNTTSLHSIRGLRQNGFGCITNFRAGFYVVRNGIATTRAPTGAQKHVMAVLGELIQDGRQQADTVLVGFYFTRNANNHERKLTAKRDVSNAQYVLSRFL